MEALAVTGHAGVRREPSGQRVRGCIRPVPERGMEHCLLLPFSRLVDADGDNISAAAFKDCTLVVSSDVRACMFDVGLG